MRKKIGLSKRIIAMIATVTLLGTSISIDTFAMDVDNESGNKSEIVEAVDTEVETEIENETEVVEKEDVDDVTEKEMDSEISTEMDSKIIVESNNTNLKENLKTESETEVSDEDEVVDVVNDDDLVASTKQLYESADGLFRYGVRNSDASQTYVTAYLGTDTNVIIPNEIDGHTITGLLGLNFPNCSPVSLTLPNTVVDYLPGDPEDYANYESLQSINVINGSEDGIHSIDGVFFIGNELEIYPAAKSDSEYIISEGASYVKGKAFKGAKNLKTIVIPGSVTKLYADFCNSEVARTLIWKASAEQIGNIHYNTTSFINGAEGTRILMRDEAAKNALLANAFYDADRFPPIEVAGDEYHATGLQFTDEFKSKLVDGNKLYVTGRNTSTPSGKCELVNLDKIYTQTNEDTIDSVTWTIDDPNNVGGMLDNNLYTVYSDAKGGKITFTGDDGRGHKISFVIYLKGGGGYALYAPFTDGSVPIAANSNEVQKCSYDIKDISSSDGYYMSNFPFTLECTSPTFDGEQTFTNSNPDVITVNDDMSMTVKGLGKTTFTATFTDVGITYTRTIEVTVTKSIRSLTFDTVTEADYTGGTLNVLKSIKDGDKTLIRDVNYTVTTSGDFKNVGTGTVTVKGKGLYTDSKTFYYTINSPEITESCIIIGNPYNGLYDENAIRLVVNGIDLKKGIDYTIFRDDIDDDGYAHYEICGINNYHGDIDNFTLKIAKAKINLDTANVEISGISNKTYTGRPIGFPSLSVSVDGEELTKYSDYTISYKNNTNVGTATVTINAVSNSLYLGSKSFTFKINKKAQEVRVNQNSCEATAGGKLQISILKPTASTTMSYKSSSKYMRVKSGYLYFDRCGVYKLTITAKETSHYTKASKTVTFIVLPKKPAISSLTSPKKGYMKVSWKKDSTVTGYQVQYSLKSNFKSAKTVTIKKNSTVSSTIKKLTANKKYYVRIRSYKTMKINGRNTNEYSSWSAKKSVKIKKK